MFLAPSLCHGSLRTYNQNFVCDMWIYIIYIYMYVCMCIHIYDVTIYINTWLCRFLAENGINFSKPMGLIMLYIPASSNLMCNEAFPEHKHPPCLFRGVKQSHIHILKILWKPICFSHVANRRRFHINNRKTRVSMWYCGTSQIVPEYFLCHVWRILKS